MKHENPLMNHARKMFTLKRTLLPLSLLLIFSGCRHHVVHGSSSVASGPSMGTPDHVFARQAGPSGGHPPEIDGDDPWPSASRSTTVPGGSPSKTSFEAKAWMDVCPIRMDDLDKLTHPDWSNALMKQEATGYGEAPKKREAIENALASALRKAVEQAVGVLVESQTRIEMARVIENSVIARTKGFVNRYQPIGEPERDLDFTGTGYAYTVKILAEIQAGALEKNLKGQNIRTKRFTFPVLKVQMAQEDKTKTLSDTNYTNDLVGRVIRSCFPGMEVQANRDPYPLDFNQPSTRRDMDRFAGADYLISGSIKIGTEPIKSYDIELAYANSNARITNLATGRNLGSTTRKGRSTKPLTLRDERIQNAIHFSVQMLASDLVAQFKEHLKQTAWANQFSVRLHFNRVSAELFQAFLNHLKQDGRVLWVGRTKYAQNNEGHFEVKFHGTASDFATPLKSAASRSRIGITITTMKMGLVEATLGLDNNP